MKTSTVQGHMGSTGFKIALVAALLSLHSYSAAQAGTDSTNRCHMLARSAGHMAQIRLNGKPLAEALEEFRSTTGKVVSESTVKIMEMMLIDVYEKKRGPDDAYIFWRKQCDAAEK